MNRKFEVLIVARELDTESMKMLHVIAEVRTTRDSSSETIQREAHNADAIILGPQGSVDGKVLEKAPNLKVVGRIGAGYQNVDVDKATKRGIPVVYSGTANSDTVADLTFGLILTVARNISKADRACKTTLDTNWDIGTGFKFMGTDVWNKTLGIIGFGRIGSRVANRAVAFDMKILVCDPYVGEKEVKGVGVECVNLPTLLKQSDFVTIHTPRTEETKSLIGENEIKMMKNGSYLINAAYGGLVDEEALYEALVEGKLAGAAIDVPEVKIGEGVFNPQKPLYKLENVVLTPVLGARTKECGPRQNRTLVEDVIKVLRGERPTWAVNPSTLP